ncbi:MAG TPA: bifunctional pyr operon transcriptional regulator/uracil phosphoribosyltransferase PyrR, partial [Oxalicibacterium sp.]
ERELPIAADFVATTISIPDRQQLVLQRAEDGRLSLTVDHA